MSKQKNKDQTNQVAEDGQEEALPGYPPYPPQEDIVRNNERVEGSLGDEGFDSQEAASSSESELQPDQAELPREPESNSEFDVTEDDLQALGPVDLSLDLGEDEQLKQRTHPVDFAGENLDVPGATDDDKREQIGAEDEENNSYSLGGDAHSDLEEGRQ
jgi:hypothetical protein